MSFTVYFSGIASEIFNLWFCVSTSGCLVEIKVDFVSFGVISAVTNQLQLHLLSTLPSNVSFLYRTSCFWKRDNFVAVHSLLRTGKCESCPKTFLATGFHFIFRSNFILFFDVIEFSSFIIGRGV